MDALRFMNSDSNSLISNCAVRLRDSGLPRYHRLLYAVSFSFCRQCAKKSGFDVVGCYLSPVLSLLPYGMVIILFMTAKAICI